MKNSGFKKVLIILPAFILSSMVIVYIFVDYHRPYFVFQNQTNREIFSVERIIVYSTTTKEIKRVSVIVGNVSANSDITHKFRTGDGTLRVAYFDGISKRELECGYVTSMLTNYIVTVRADGTAICDFIKK